MFSEEDHDNEEGEYQSSEEALSSEAHTYQIRFSSTKNTREVDLCKKDETNKKRHTASHSGNNPGRMKRVVSCKRKTFHLSVSSRGRRRPSVTGKTFDVTNKETEQRDRQEMFYKDPCEFPLNLAQGSEMEARSKYSDYFTELSKDHNTMTQVLFGRNLRLNIALTLWQRHIGELLAYLVRLQDTSVLVDCLPIITKSLQDETPYVSIGFCVDLFPLVKNILTSQYDEYLMVGLHWVQSVLKKWWPQLSGNGDSECDIDSSDGNIHVIKQQLQELWEQGNHFCLAPGTTGEIAKVIESYFFQLH